MMKFIKNVAFVVLLVTAIGYICIQAPGIQLKRDKLSKMMPIDRREYDAKQSIVRIFTQDKQPHCSGTIISDEYVLTAAHCLYNSNGFMKDTKYIVVTQQYEKRDAEPVGLNARLDTGLLKGHFEGLPKGIMNTTDTVSTLTQRALEIYVGSPPPTDLFVNCGFPQLQKELLCSELEMVPKQELDSLESRGYMSPGMSGGPVMILINGEYQIIAVNTGVMDFNEIGANLIFGPTLGLLGTYNIDPEDNL